jgi:hypothetical protein
MLLPLCVHHALVFGDLPGVGVEDLLDVGNLLLEQLDLGEGVFAGRLMLVLLLLAGLDLSDLLLAFVLGLADQCLDGRAVGQHLLQMTEVAIVQQPLGLLLFGQFKLLVLVPVGLLPQPS